ncbi:MAG: Gfo/Idh/MocA family oxidoreductase [Acidobacteria bacterium]|nr:Gfo/Idh/MocA family oxidoreductase [Acidobacteriota bacterium]
MTASSSKRKVRYAVAGLGHIAQVAVLPAFEHAKKNSALAALVSSDSRKLRKLGRKYGVDHLASYDEYDALLESGEIDAVYIALPNSMHREFSVRAANAGIHVLCEKPMAVTSSECRAMIRAAEKNDVRLMIAYRLHFERANMRAAEVVASGKIGESKIFTSAFTMNVREGDVRLRRDLGGGPANDIGIYCINAARYLFRDEPVEVSAIAESADDSRFDEVPEMIAATLRFPRSRLASFTISFGAASTGSYRLIGTKGDLRLDPAYAYAGELRHELTVGKSTKETTYAKRDQFAPEILHFSSCVLDGSRPEPSGYEGLIDVQIIEGIEKSIRSNGRAIGLKLDEPKDRPDISQQIRRAPVEEPETIKAKSPKKN